MHLLPKISWTTHVEAAAPAVFAVIIEGSSWRCLREVDVGMGRFETLFRLNGSFILESNKMLNYFAHNLSAQ